jgi:hypothetical protein
METKDKYRIKLLNDKDMNNDNDNNWTLMKSIMLWLLYKASM